MTGPDTGSYSRFYGSQKIPGVKFRSTPGLWSRHRSVLRINISSFLVTNTVNSARLVVGYQQCAVGRDEEIYGPSPGPSCL